MFWQYAWKRFWRRRTKATLTISGIAFSIALLVAVLSISRSVEQSVAGALNAAGADMVVQRRVEPCPFDFVKLPKDLAAIPMDVAEKMADHPATEEVSAVLELWAFYQGHPTVVAGIDPRKKTLGPVRIAPREDEDGDMTKCCAVVKGRFLVPSDDFHTMLTLQYAEAKGLDVGDKVHIGPDSVFEVVGIVDLSGTARIAGAEAFLTLEMAQQMFGQGTVASTLFVSLKDAARADDVAALAARLIGPEASITTSQNVEAGTAALASVTRKSLVAVSGLVIAFVLLLLTRHAVESVTERLDEVGLMKAIGWRDGEVGRIFMCEATFSGLIGGALGCVLGFALAWAYGHLATLKLPPALASFPPCSTTPPPLSLPLTIAPAPWIFVLGLLAALLIGTLAGSAAARRAAKLPPSEALRRI